MAGWMEVSEMDEMLRCGNETQDGRCVGESELTNILTVQYVGAGGGNGG